MIQRWESQAVLLSKIKSLQPYCGVKLGRCRARATYPICEDPVIGLDTEYRSNGKGLLSFQLFAPPDKGVFIEVKDGEHLTPEWLYDEALELLELDKPPGKIMLATFFSLAELQFLPVYTEGFNIREYNGGSLDVSFAVEGTELRVFDIARWFTGGLAGVAESFGYKKLEMDTTNVTRSSLRSPKFRDYAVRDAKLCFQIVRDLRKVFMEETGIDPLPARTAASASANAFRNLHVKKDIACDHNGARFLAMRGCWGGRAEVFERGRLTGLYHEYDIKSAYPNAALWFGELPCEKSWKERTAWRYIDGDKGGFARIRFSYPADCQYPCLPVALKGAMIYPLNGETVCTFAEIQYAREQGADIKLIEAYGYRRGTTALNDYLQWTMDKRKDSKGPANYMYKLLGNSIIGKLAQGLNKIPIDKYQELAELSGYTLDELLACTTEELRLLAVLHGMVNSKGKSTIEIVSCGSIFMPSWNGLICGLARRVLAELIVDGKAVYCHTDSVWTQTAVSSSILPVELKRSGKVVCVRRGLACIGDIHQKGAHVPRHSIWCADAAKVVLSEFTGESEEWEYYNDRPLKFKEAKRKGKPIGTWVTEKRTASTVWDGRRRLLSDGKTVPWANCQQFLDAKAGSR